MYSSPNQMVWVCHVGTSGAELPATDNSALLPSHLRSSISESRFPSQRPVTCRLILPPGDSYITFPLSYATTWCNGAVNFFPVYSVNVYILICKPTFSSHYQCFRFPRCHRLHFCHLFTTNSSTLRTAVQRWSKQKPALAFRIYTHANVHRR